MTDGARGTAAAGATAGASEGSRPKVIFFGNGMLADYAKAVLAEGAEVIFHARTREDLDEATRLKREHPEAFGVLASFGVLIRSEVLEAFEPEGILNLHPSLLPKYRGASPIESAILAGDMDFGYSIMKLAKAMDAGPIYHQETLKDLPLDKTEIYRALAGAGARWLLGNLTKIRIGTADGKAVLGIEPATQNESEATFTTKLDKSMSILRPEEYTAQELYRQIVAYQGFPKPKYEFFGKTCIILKAHTLRVTDILCEAAGLDASSPLMLKCKDRNFVVIDQLQPEGKKPMDAISFMNGYGKKR